RATRDQACRGGIRRRRQTPGGLHDEEPARSHRSARPGRLGCARRCDLSRPLPRRDLDRPSMIGFLEGRVASKAPPQLTIDVAGVGYEVEAPMSTFFHLPAVGGAVRLLTHLVVREDAHVLYGFATEEERRLFRSLLKVSGVGPKIALALLSGISVEAFSQCVLNED